MNEAECINMQTALKHYIVKEDTFNKQDIRYIAGVDIAYWKENNIEKAVCCIVVIDMNTLGIVERKHLLGEVTFPYIPGCLAFREIPLILETVKLLEVDVDIFMFDGNGILHPRNMGLATQISFYLNKPTIGVAKTYYKVDDTWFTEPGDSEGDTSDICLNGQVVGVALRTHEKVKPIFVSIGNYISLETSIEFVNKLINSESHIPIPTRQADLDTHIYRTKYRAKGI